MTHRSSFVVVPFTVALLALTAVGCTTGRRPGGPGTGIDGGGGPLPGEDGGPRLLPDGGTWTLPDGATPVNPCATGCGPMELCGDENRGNGLDDDCNGQVDEGCVCNSGETRPCFAGPPDRRDIGACADGISLCNEFNQWGPCGGGVSPSAETCNGADDDCNGSTDDGLSSCTSSVTCPGNETVPPLAMHTLDGTRVYTGAARSWAWAIDCPASVPAELCPSLSSPTAQSPTVYFTASGAYRVSVTVVTADGSEAGCAWTVYVRGGGLRVELNWDTMLDTAGGTDVDLHLHRWTSNTAETNFFTDDDCYYANCQPDVFDSEISWSGHADSPLSNCQDAPHGGGAEWRTRGSCRNPRLDVDTNGTDGACDGSVTDPNSDAFCAPENINVDEPVIGAPYRILVNYYSADVPQTYPTVNIYCGGSFRGSYGVDPLVTLRNGDEYGELNDNWYVADVVFFQGDCGLDCYIYPLSGVIQGTPDPSDPFGISGVVPFGEPWSCTYDPSTSTCTER